MVKRKGKRKAIDVTLPQDLISNLDDIAGELDATRSYVVKAMLEYALENIADIFPYEEEGESEEEEETEGEDEED